MKAAFAFLFALMLVMSSVHAGTPPAGAQVASDRLITALVGGDFEVFISNGEAAFQALPKKSFDSVVAQLAPRFKAGYEIGYLGELKQKGYQVTLWKISFKDGRDDSLATLSIKNGKVGGYWIK